MAHLLDEIHASAENKRADQDHERKRGEQRQADNEKDLFPGCGRFWQKRARRCRRWRIVGIRKRRRTNWSDRWLWLWLFLLVHFISRPLSCWVSSHAARETDGA